MTAFRSNKRNLTLGTGEPFMTHRDGAENETYAVWQSAYWQKRQLVRRKQNHSCSPPPQMAKAIPA